MSKLLETILEMLEGQIKRRKGWQDEECEISGGDARYLIDEVKKLDEAKVLAETEAAELKKKVAAPAPVPAPTPAPKTE